MAILHGFAENQNAFLETAIHHALNGFEVVMVDFKSHGLASGIRGCKW